MAKILLVEDDRAVQRALRRMFESEGFAVEIVSDGSRAIEVFRSYRPAVVILDLRLPGMSGRDVCRQIKPEAPQCPIIVLSAMADVADKVLLLELGADDYMTKPFSPRELLARVHVAIRRAVHSTPNSAPNTDVYSFEDVSIDFAKMELTRASKPIPLTAQEFKVLKFLTQNTDRVISREELLNEAWGYQSYPSTRTVDNHILRLRQKLEKDPEFPAHFRTVHRVGYKFVR
jgi:DNA-binding response OmpR family regulator